MRPEYRLGVTLYGLSPGPGSGIRPPCSRYYWIDERLKALETAGAKDFREPGGAPQPQRRESVLAPHREARRVFQRLLVEAQE